MANKNDIRVHEQDICANQNDIWANEQSVWKTQNDTWIKEQEICANQTNLSQWAKYLEKSKRWSNQRANLLDIWANPNDICANQVDIYAKKKENLSERMSNFQH